MEDQKEQIYEELEKGENKKPETKKKSSLLKKITLGLTFTAIVALSAYFIYTKSAVPAVIEPKMEPLVLTTKPDEAFKTVKSIDYVMKPKSIAILGASKRKGSIGNDLIKILTENNYKGKIYPVNPKGGEIENLPAYKSVKDAPGDVDLAVIILSAKFVLNAIDECGEKGVKAVVIVSAGFKEVGAEGAQLEQQLKDKLNKYKIRCIGPNVLGVINNAPDVSMDAAFDPLYPEKGKIGFVSQSGALGSVVFTFLKGLKIGISQFISIGNQLDINAEHAIEYWENEDNVQQIVLYMESIANPKNFRKLATRISKKKPIFALKAGRSAAGASAASSHTGSLAGTDNNANSLLMQSGVIREYSLKSLFNTLKAFTYSALPKGNRAAIITNAGGPGILCTDAASENGMVMAKLSEKTQKTLRSFLPDIASVKNPVDMVASSTLENFKMAVDAVASDDGVDIVFVLVCRLKMDEFEVAKTIMKAKEKFPNKCIIGIFVFTEELYNKLAQIDLNMPFFNMPEEAAEAVGKLIRYRKWLERPEGKIPTFNVDKEKVKEIVKQSLKEGRAQLTTKESIDILSAYGIRVCMDGLAKTEDEAVEVANKIGYPIVMKMTSKTTSHKTDVGGVIVNIRSDEELRKEYQGLMERLKAKNLLDGLEGVIIQEMVKGEREMVVGLATDKQFGPMIMFGLGGIFIEVMKDVTFRVTPITDIDAKEMIKSVKSYKLLEGARGTKPANMQQIEETLLRVSQLVTDFSFIDELDINPLLISEKTGEGVAVDGRIKVRIDDAKAALGL